MKLSILELAEADLFDAFQFYERQASGIGRYFLDTLYSDIESLRLYAGIHRKVFGFHRVLSRRFPFAIYYICAESEVQIWRVLDCRKNPKSIYRQLKNTRKRIR